MSSLYLSGYRSNIYKNVDVGLAPTLYLGHVKVKGHEEQPEAWEEKCKRSEALHEFYELMRIEMPETQLVQEPDRFFMWECWFYDGGAQEIEQWDVWALV